jgi:CheY-like chemotaxis protein
VIRPENTSGETVLVADSDVMVRHAISEYLRDCGYRVIEAASIDEAMAVLSATPEITVHIVFSAVEMGGSADGFHLARWLRAHRPGTEIVLAGSKAKAAHEAGDLCKDGPHLSKPYEPEQVVEWIKKLHNLKPPG